MYYSLEELLENLTKKIIGLGIKKEFLENPAFSSALLEIWSMAHQMTDPMIKPQVVEKDGIISVDCISSTGVKYSLQIWSSSPDTIKCIRTLEEKPYHDIDGQYVRTKHAHEIIAKINDHNWIEIIDNGSSIDNRNCGPNITNNSTWSQKKEYNAYGVMVMRENKHFRGGDLQEGIDRARVDSMLYIPRQAFSSGAFFSDNYEYRELLRRETLDVARIVVDDRRKGIQYNALTELNGEHGYRDIVSMRGWGGSALYPKDVLIGPKSSEEIEKMIQLEGNSIVQEGLRKYAVDREKFRYDASLDSTFRCTGLEQAQNVR